ncbi:MAG: hypothetical protein Q4D56_06635 [Bacteroides sp.]|nr:hypothetical protein [Bacteroides sp.]
MKRLLMTWVCVFAVLTLYAQKAPMAVTRYGTLEGVCESGISVFRG